MVPVIYLIVLTDPAQVVHLRATYPNGITMSPSAAAALYSAPIGGQAPSGRFVAPGIQIPSGQGTTLAAFYTALGGTMAGANCVGPHGETSPDAEFYWLGFFAAQVAPLTAAAPIFVAGTTVRFIDGFELPRFGSGSTGGSYHFSRDASRTADGLGYAYRANSNDYLVHAVTGLTPNEPFSCERFYLRLRALPSGGNDQFWSAWGSSEGGGPMLHLDVSPTGTLLLYNQGNGGAPGTLIVTTDMLVLNRWYRIDVQWWASHQFGGSVTVWVNGIPYMAGAPVFGPGIGVDQHQNAGRVGEYLGAVSHGLECDLDDWVNVASIDVRYGTHITLLRATGFGSGHSANWAGDWRELVGLDPEVIPTADQLICTTSGAKLEIQAEAQAQPQGGAFAVLLSAYIGAGSGGNGTLALTTDTGVVASTTVALNASTWVSGLWSVLSGLVPGFVVQLTKDASITSTRVCGLYAHVACMGFFGPEDLQSWVTPTAPGTDSNQPWIHNAPYAATALAQNNTASFQPLSIESGLTTGDGLGQSLLIENPVHWFWARPITGDTGGSWWWSTVVAAAGRLDSLLKPLRVAAVRIFGTAAEFLLGGSDTQSNLVAMTYQWIAVSDPGHRFLLNGAFAHAPAVAAAGNLLQDATFTPEALFATVESASSSANKHYFKGIGHASLAASPLDTVENATVASLQTGSITSRTPLHGANPNTLQTAYSAWRRTDPWGQTGWFALMTYTGDGTGSRWLDVDLTPTDCDGEPNPLGGVSPLFAIVTPHTGVSYFRDPSHTGTNSSQMGGANSAAAIIGGDINQIQVGSTLNAGGVIYDVFVIGGLANPGGWSPNTGGSICPVCMWPPGTVPGPVEPVPPPPLPVPSAPPPPEPPPTLPGSGCEVESFGGGG